MKSEALLLKLEKLVSQHISNYYSRIQFHRHIIQSNGTNSSSFCAYYRMLKELTPHVEQIDRNTIKLPRHPIKLIQIENPSHSISALSISCIIAMVFEHCHLNIVITHWKREFPFTEHRGRCGKMNILHKLQDIQVFEIFASYCRKLSHAHNMTL